MATSIAPRIVRAPRRAIAFVPRTFAPPGESPARRLVNITVALAGIALTLPLMLVIAVLVKTTSRGPVLFRQVRIGRDRRDRRAPAGGGNGRRRVDYGGAPFTMWKFRTMYDGSGARQVWASPDDPRVTPVGRLLRRLRLDELPQLFNVLCGDMNVVGPRPEQPTIVLQLCRAIDGYRHRHAVRPGITGLAQVSLPYDRTTDDVRRKLGCDLDYIARASAAEDLRIMMRTVPVMLRRESGW